MQLEGKVALITGGSSGIGKATAQLFAAEGAKVALLDRVEDRLHQTVAELREAGGQALGVQADVSNVEQMQTAIQKAGDEWGTINVVFANAGINGVWAALEDITPEEWDTTLNVNLKGTFLTVKYALPYLKQQGGS